MGGTDIAAAGRGSDSAQRRVDRALRAAYEYEDAETGLRTLIDHMSVDPDGRYVRVGIRIQNADGVELGGSRRIWRVEDDGSLTVHHSVLNLDRTVQGGGFGQRFNARAEAAYRAAGVTEIDLEANLDVGGYTWATQGYDFNGAADLATVAKRFRKLAQQDPAVASEIQALLKRSTARHFAAGTHPTPFEWAMLGRDRAASQRRPDGREILLWPGKQTMLGSKWKGRKTIRAPAERSADFTAAAHRNILDLIAANSLEYANAVAEQVPAYPDDVDTPIDQPSEYAAGHHLISAPPAVARLLIDRADAFFSSVEAAKGTRDTWLMTRSA